MYNEMQKPINVAIDMFSFAGLRRSVRKVYLHNRVVCCLGHRDPKTYCFGQNLYVRPTQHVHCPYKHTQSTLSKTSTIIVATNQSRKKSEA